MEDFNWPDLTAWIRGVRSCNAVVFDAAVNLRFATTGPDLANEKKFGVKKAETSENVNWSVPDRLMLGQQKLLRMFLFNFSAKFYLV